MLNLIKLASIIKPQDHKETNKSPGSDIDARKVSILTKDIKDKAFKTPKPKNVLKEEIKEALLYGIK